MIATEPLLAALGEPGQPEATFAAVAAALRAEIGYGLLTFLKVVGDEVERVWTSHPAEYPVSGRKPMGPTPWGMHVIRDRTPYLGRDRDAIRWAFFDHALIASMGLGCTINVPVVYDGRTVGTINALDAEHRYGERELAVVVSVAPILVAAFLATPSRGA